MDDINTIYYNDFGIAFQWKRCAIEDYKKIQLVFRNTGLFLSFNELLVFSKNIEKVFSKPSLCKDCKENESCKSLLQEAPNPQISFAVSYIELKSIQDLVKGTLVQLELDNVFKINAICKNR
ncbi:hypothetical protein [uncultured Lacinutrix sp.]|uniref:hypothetical protein n=1 Tax=uncultured Lacinutrix sp. TaxID=574032 RepID=UPI00262C4FFB|nr:hypothetical protein [uncultured Lacinutrix sp.]